MPAQNSNSLWGSSYRLVASEKWKAKSAAMGRDVTEALVEYSRPKPGMKVLDLASGTGEPAISVASLVAPDGHVTALDRSTELLEIAAERAHQRALTNLSTHEADANRLPFPDQTFDLVTSRFGVMFFDESALHEAYRVLKPGARACFAAWGPVEQPYWATMMGIVHKHAQGAIVPAEQNPFKYSQPGSLAAALRKAGFEAEEETRNVDWTWHGPVEEVWEYARSVAAPFLPMLERVPVDQWEAIDSEIHSALRNYVVGNSVNFGAVVVFAAGIKA